MQDNISVSKKGTLRGLHFQKNPYSQGKLIKVFNGKILDCVVDLRKDSKTYGQYQTFELSASDNKSLYVGRGFAHGFWLWRKILQFFISVMPSITSLSSKALNGMIKI